MSDTKTECEFQTCIPVFRDRPIFENSVIKEITFYFIVVTYSPCIGPQKLRWILEKRYSDFEKLHTELLKLNINLPPLPSPWIKKSNSNLEKRRNQLDNYLHLLISAGDIIILSVPFQAFIGVLKNLNTKPSESLEYSYSFRSISLQSAVSLAVTGDLILFHTNNSVLSSLTRSILRTQIDHVAVIVKVDNPNQNILRTGTFLLEATSDGVKKYPLYYRLASWGKTGASTVLLRRLLINTNLSEQQNKILFDYEKLYKFIDEVDGKPYSLSISKLFHSLDEPLQESYFCSELVLAIYQVLGILPTNVSVNKYLPRDFASNDITLNNNAILDEPILIDMIDPELSQSRVINTK